ncbi:MAG: TRZ/ATZ family hydrolase [Gammaproteobacteria bacterium]|nr:TRZ/ATZ family hydrolase [Gammaproteobacteria bacterium]MCP4090864.1 TRZ/ATZ family hydrolase [Gammaproteobacteria bacterium]MCP4275528.1 TRZ/ATZ family hydrolase [Gammaproteobacteria bacterium]MCP4832250.1 TRZ/ATZ family hydrolase [Gammaproteobacteria bacterium]MCP4930304.1 TRZ/ATZ family hydrolase [Gammaproteobacteria bacterium]
MTQASQPDLIIAPRWIIPVEPALTVLTEHALLVSNGRILGLEKCAAARHNYPDTTWIERPNHVLIPGLINAHTHAAMSLLRGYADDMSLESWLSEHIWPAEQQWVSREFVRDGTDLAILEMIRGGTTCFQDMYFFPDEVAAVAAERGIRALAGMIVLNAPTVWAADTDEYLARGLVVHDRYRDHPLVDTSFAPHAPYTVDDDAFKRIITLANQLDVNIHIHVHETANEIQNALDTTGMRPLARLEKLGLLSPQLNAVHMTQLDTEEIELLAARGISVVHCPESNMKLASGICSLEPLIAAGINVALGTDGAASNNDLDMLGELRSAALLAKVHSGNAATLPANVALEMATINGARALGIANETGSLVTGKSADMVCVDLSAPSCQPVHNPLSQLVYSAQRDQVSDVWVAGRQLYGENGFTTMNATEILERANAWLNRMQDNPS